MLHFCRSSTKIVMNLAILARLPRRAVSGAPKPAGGAQAGRCRARHPAPQPKIQIGSFKTLVDKKPPWVYPYPP